ncbi:Glyoxalase/Bleomycin resistance protein/Dioxygenase superfamily protein [Actinacidiphila alni]|uniref:Glyoxalase/Bleomycin resistance protein/Dioxygenase superfamily protein n=1 Tax=Actinacidiphila alni TaxID=380248 RepID=A0A1I2LPY7_9ACTN|nr:VOC family protein [Actinacidiphila alni]SFF81582.1 Glyoxalase/Bleomycin resistance protein/Dioxygenase superfamily protein [Actinacidiphila alni]
MLNLRLNHAVLFVSDLRVSVDFYRDVLGFTYSAHGDDRPGAAFLRAPGSANDHDLGLFQVGPQAASSAVRERAVGLYHLAWEVETLDALESVREKLLAAGSLRGASNHGLSKSLYAQDPDGLEFEIVWIVPAQLAAPHDLAVGRTILPLDIEAEVATYGRHTPGGHASVASR